MDSFGNKADLTSHTEDSAVVCITYIEKVEGEEEIFINRDAVKEVFMRDEIADLPVAIYSIAGPFRSGKSFLLNLLLRHFEPSKNETCHKVDANEQMPRKFEWKGGKSPHTRGIYILKQPLLVDINEDPDKKAALFLMDTQGIFDNKCAESEQRLIGAFSFIISSMQIFNLKNEVQSVHFDHVYKFIKLAEEMKQTTQSTSFIQPESLMFLIRDWISDDFDHGFKGGEEYLKTALEGERDSRAPECQVKEKFFKDKIKTIPCFLQPPPERTIQGMSKKQEQLLIKEIGQEFLSKAEELFQHLLAPQHLHLKRMNETTLYTCGQFSEYLYDIIPIINKKDFDSNLPHFILIGAIHQFKHVISKHQIKFAEELWKKISVDMPHDKEKGEKGEYENFKNSLAEIYNNVRSNILEEYEKDEKPNIPNYQKKFKSGFERVLERISQAYEHCVKAQEVYDKHMAAFKEEVGILLLKKKQEKATKNLKTTIEKLRNEINEEISNQCCDYFRKEGEQILQRKTNQHQNIAKRAGVAGKLIRAAAVAIPLIVVPASGSLGTAIAIGGVAVGGMAAGAGVGTTIVGATSRDITQWLNDKSCPAEDIQMSIKTKMMIPLKMGIILYTVVVDDF